MKKANVLRFYFIKTILIIIYYLKLNIIKNLNYYHQKNDNISILYHDNNSFIYRYLEIIPNWNKNILIKELFQV